MKKILTTMGVIFSIIIVIVIISFVFLAPKSWSLNKECIAFCDKIVPIIFSDFNEDTLFEYSSVELIESTSQEASDKLSTHIKTLGKYRSLKESKSDLQINYSGKREEITAKYVAQVEFETGPAEVLILLNKLMT